MRTATLLILSAAGIGLAAVVLQQTPAGAVTAAQSSPPGPLPVPGEYKLDLNHANLTFKVRHMGLSNYVARFNKIDATLNLDPANIGGSSLVATVDTGSVDVFYASEFRQTHPNSTYGSWKEELARSPRYLNADQFPQATFRSTRVESTGANTARVYGDLTLVGKTQPMTFDVTLIGSRGAPGGGAVGFEATGQIDRASFGITHLASMVGNSVAIEFNGEFRRPPAPR